MPHVISKLANDNAYTLWSPAEGSKENKAVRKKQQILIKGGSGVANKNIITPHGVATEVTDSELEALSGVPSFKRHLSKGFLVVGKGKASENSIKSAANDLSTDISTPLTPAQMRKEKAAKEKEESRG